MEKKLYDDPQRQVALQSELAKVGSDLRLVKGSPNDKGDFKALIANGRRASNLLAERANECIAREDVEGAERVMEAQATLGSYLNRWERVADEQKEVQQVNADMARQAGFAPPAGSMNDNYGGRQSHDKVRALTKGEKFATGGQDVGYGFGDFIKAAVCGTNRGDIKAALSEGSDSAGGFSVPEVLLNQIIDSMRARQIAVRAGAMTVPLTSDNVRMLKIESDPKPTWRAENSLIQESEPTFSAVTFEPKSLAVLVKVSRELLEDSLNINEALTLAFAGSMAEALDRAVMFGSGMNNEPLGLINQGIPEITMGDNGGEIVGYQRILDLLETFQSNDNWDSPSAMIMHPRTWRAIEGLVNNEGDPMRAPESIYVVPKHISTNMPIDETQGSATNASSILIGDWQKLLIGIRSQMRVEILRETFGDRLQYGFIAHLRADAQVMHQRSFARLAGIVPKAATVAKSK